MAIYNFQSRILSRSRGHSSVEYAAYLAAQKLFDERYNELRDFAKKQQRQRLFHSQILAPDNSPAWVHNRQELWNRNEAAERRKDSQVGRELVVSLPRELSHEQKVAAGLRFIREEYTAKGMVADAHFHNFTGEGSDNPHMQVLLTTRRIEQQGFAKRKEEAWRPPIIKDPKTGKAIVDPEFIKAERKVWEQHCNRALEQAGLEQRVDCRSLKDKGIDRLPQPKLGKAHHMERRAEWAGRTNAGDRWREAQRINALKAEKERLNWEHEAIGQEIRKAMEQHAYRLGQELARQEHQAAPQSAPYRKKKPQPGRSLEPWKRDWERQHEQQRKRRASRRKMQNRAAAIPRDKAKNHPQTSPPAMPLQDERHIIEQWLKFHEWGGER